MYSKASRIPPPSHRLVKLGPKETPDHSVCKGPSRPVKSEMKHAAHRRPAEALLVGPKVKLPEGANGL